MTINTTSVKYTIVATIAMLFVVFALVPMLSQHSSTDVSFGATVALAFGGDGDGSAGGDGAGGGDGGGCCGGDGGGTGGGDTGGDTVPYIPPPPPETECTLYANPTTINQGGSSTLTWTTDNANTVSINQGIGSVGKGDSTSVSPSQTTTYTLTATGDGGTVTCHATVTVTPPPAPICTLDLDKTSITQGQSVTATWTSQNGVSATLNSNSVALNGNQSFSPTVNTTYTLVVTGQNNQTVTCQKSVTVTQVPNAPICTLVANPTSINQGGSSTLTWTTQNATTVTLNQGIGSVAVNGNTSVSPAQTTNYLLTATGPGGTVTCPATVTVVPPSAPICTFDLDKSTIALGESVTATWTSQNGISATLNNNSVALNGNQTFSPVGNTTYTLVVTGQNNQTVTCQKSVTVTTTPDPLLCTLTGNPTSLPFGGGNTTLTWTTDNADSVSIDQGIGGVALDGQQSVFVGSDKTFTLTAVRGSETKQCSVTIDVGPENPPALSCDSFTASPSNFGSSGGNTTLTWATTGATSVSIDQGIGAVSVDGSRQESVSGDKTYTLTATNGSQTVTCTASVDVDSGGGGGGSSAPRCDYLRASDTKIRKGETITLSWKTRRGNELKIEPNIFSTTDDDEVDEGSIKVKPTKDTRYTLTVERGSRKDTCSVSVDVSGSDVTVLSARDQQPITTISLTQIPYTGFEAGPFLTSLFYTLLALWSMAVAYVLVVKRGSVFGFSLPQVRPAHSSVIPHAEYHAAVATVVAPATAVPMNLPTGAYAFDTDEDEESSDDESSDDEYADDDSYSDLENRAHRENVLLSSDALRLVADHGATDEERIRLLDEVIARAKAAYPREDGWIVLNRERISALFA